MKCSGRIRSWHILFLFLISIHQVPCPAQIVDSTGVTQGAPGKEIVHTLLAPSILIASGIATMNDRGFYSSQDAYECMQDKAPDFQTNLDDYLIFVPAAAVYGLNLAGVKGKNSFLDRSFVYAFSFSLAAATTNLMKRNTGILRPDGSDHRSFPSSHTAIAFVSATFLHEEYKDQSIWYGIAGYSIATASGMIRMLNKKHWLSDVLVGAGIGILTTKIVYHIYPVVKGSRIKRSGNNNHNNLALLPYASRDHYGIFLQYRIR